MEFRTIAKARKETGLSYLGGVNISAKMVKNEKVSGQMTYVMYLAPASESGYNVCPHSTPECRLGCLSTSGRAGIEVIAGGDRIKNSRIKKTKLFFEDNLYFMAWMIAEIKSYKQKAQEKGLKFSIRLNGTSDIDWTQPTFNGKNVFEHFPDVQFYDYTKNIGKFLNNKPSNYNLTFSYTGHPNNVSNCLRLLESGQNIAVVFNVKNENELPKTFMGYTVINGDETDFRPNDGKGVIVGLKWKNIGNKAINEQIKKSIFVVQKENEFCVY